MEAVTEYIKRNSNGRKQPTRTTMLTTLILTPLQLTISLRKMVLRKSIASGEPAETAKEGT